MSRKRGLGWCRHGGVCVDSECLCVFVGVCVCVLVRACCVLFVDEYIYI